MSPVLLLIEPNAIFRSRIKSHLQQRFYIVAKEDPFDALKWIEQRNVPDLIICASQLIHLYGPDFVKVIRLYFHKNAVPIVMTTAQMHYGERAEAILSGANAYLPISINNPNFREVLKIFINRTMKNSTNIRSIGR